MASIKSPYIISVGVSATRLQHPTNPPGVNTRSRIIRNLSAVSVFLGGADVTASTTSGWELLPGSDHIDTITNGDIWARVASGSANVQVWEASE